MNRSIVTSILLILISLSSSSQKLTAGDSLLADEKLIYVFKKDVFKFFSLIEYDTPLKKRVFSETAEYKQKLRVLDSLSKQKYYYPYSSISAYEELKNQLKYNIQSKSFKIILDVNAWEPFPIFASPPKSIKISNPNTVVWFKNLPTTKKYDLAPCYFEYIFIPTDEKTALEIENSRDSIDIIFVFTPLGLQKNTFKYFNLNQRKGEDISWECIVALNLRVVLINKSSKQIYYSKTY